MIIRGKGKVQINGKNKPVWVLGTDTPTELDCSVAVGDLAKARGLEKMDRLCARESVYAAMVYV